MIAAPIHGGHHVNALSINITPVFEQIADNAKSYVDLINAYTKMKDLAELIKLAEVNEGNIEQVEETLMGIEDVINIIEDKAQGINVVKRFITNKALGHVATIQFVLSNKAADYKLENR